MHYFCILTLLGVIVIASADNKQQHSYGNRPRGVALLKAALYEEKDEFECLDGSKKIPFDQVNDDYCDCADGSDEPGTSACPNGHFHCLNIGHRGLDIPSSRVNDFICDCCDGSDEWDSGVECPNVCSQLGQKAREDAVKYRATLEVGFKQRQELSKQGEKQITESKTNIGDLKKQLDGLQPSKDEAEKKKNEVEERERAAKDKHDQAWNAHLDEKKKKEATELFEKLDVDKDKKITLNDLKNFKEFDTDENGEVSDDEAKDYLSGSDELDIEAFIDKGFREIALRFQSKPKPVTTEEKADEDNIEETGGEEEEGISDEVVEPPPQASDEEQKPPYDDATQALIKEADEARREYQEVLTKYNEVENTIQDSERFLEFDYGTDHAWAPLKGKCVELDESQYTYRLCLFDRAVQKERGGHSEVNLGHWKEWTGPDGDKHSTQKYDRGQSCWNGPERSTEVVIECGEETKLVETSEPSKCEYRFRLQSPAACTDPAKFDENAHTEL